MSTAVTTINQLSYDEFGKQAHKALKETLGVKGEWIIEPLYEMIYVMHGARHVNFITEDWDSEMFWNVQRLLWINFSGGGACAYAAEAVLQGIGLGEHVPADFGSRV